MRIIDVSHSELDALRQCPHKHSLAFRQLWVPPKVSQALGRGITWHKVMEMHYKAIKAGWTDTRRNKAIVKAIWDSDLDQEQMDLLAWMYDGYVERYGNDPDWEILGIEEQGRVLLPGVWRVGGEDVYFRLNFRLDLVVQTRYLKPKIWIVDHKSHKDLPKEKELDLDDQMGLYTWAKHMLDVPVFGVHYSTTRTYRHKEERPLDERFGRIPLFRNQTELNTIAWEAAQHFARGYDYAENEAPRSPDSERCRWRCPFTEPCLAGRKGVSEKGFLQSAGFRQQTEEEHWKYRGYSLRGGK